MFFDLSSSSRTSTNQTLLIVTSVCLLLVAGTTGATVITQHYEFSEPVLAEQNGVFEIIMDGAWSHGEPGTPILPMFGAQILLPPGEIITEIEVVPGERITLDGSYAIAVGQRQYPLSYDGPAEPDQPLSAIYDSPAVYPGKYNDQAKVGLFRGYRISAFALHPVEYVPTSGTITWMTDCEVRITTAPDANALIETGNRIRHDATTIDRLAGMVDNPADAIAYRNIERTAPASRDLDPSDAYSYLIITTITWANHLDGLVDFETRRGHKTGLFTREWIDVNYPGTEQERIRNFIIDAYATWPVDYVLLVGDANAADGIPHRGLYANGYGTIDANIPGDLYYGCLDGNWNSDGDSYFGEPGEEDYYHEVGVGRVAISNTTELQNFLTKNYRYQVEPVLSECNTAKMVGELLWSEPTWGGDYKDEVLFGSSMHGYTTVGFPFMMNMSTLYDRTSEWTASQLITMMNNGLNIINHLGHCDTGYMMKFYTSDIGQFTNDGVNHINNFVYSQGCFPGAFDDTCIGEQLQCLPYGPVAFVINSRYGWGQHESTNGSSQYFDRQFFDAIFGENIHALADANDDSKMDNVWSIDYGANRWCYYELNLFGDPAMKLWSATPSNLNLISPETVYIGAPELQVTVTTAGGSPQAGALVAVFSDDYSVYATAISDVAGIATLHPVLTAPTTLNVTANANNRLPVASSIQVVPPDGPYLIFESAVVLDATGDDDGMLDEGEVAGIEVVLENVGIDNTTGVTAILSSEDVYVSITDDSATFPNIPASGFGTSDTPFTVEIDGDAPDGHVLDFSFVAAANEGSWDGNFSLTVEAPILATSGDLLVNDISGNNSGTADAGETISLQIYLQNTGHSAADDLTAALSCSDPNVIVLGGTTSCPDLPAGTSGAWAGWFEIEILPGCPEPCTINFDLQVTGGNGYTADLVVALPVGGWFDDMENDMGWVVGADGDNASAGLWTRADPVGTVYNTVVVQMEDDHTPAPGTNCYVTGNGEPGGTAGANDVDGGKTTLLTPIFNLDGATDATVSYWRWYTNNAGNNPGEDWWDVDVTNDGVNWVSLEHTQTTNASWVQMTFDLSLYITFTDHVQIRFVADDSGVGGSLVEAGVDDFLLDAIRPLLTAVDDTPAGLPTRLALNASFPNPFNPKTTISFELPHDGQVELAIYDVSGRRVTTLASGLLTAGQHERVWFGRDRNGRQVASGIYFSRLRSGSETLTRKMVLLK